jgi:hypothetical protein
MVLLEDYGATLAEELTLIPLDIEDVVVEA